MIMSKKKKKINFSTVKVSFNTTHVAPKMMKSDWDEVNACIEKIQDVGWRAGSRVLVSSKYNVVHCADYVEDAILGTHYRLICSGRTVYVGFASNWDTIQAPNVTCERCLGRLRKR